VKGESTMIDVDIQNLQAELLRLYGEGKQSEQIVLYKDGEPMAQLHYSRSNWSKSKGPRPLGLAQGMGQIHPDCFDPLPPDIVAAFNKEEPPGEGP
jgi:hypothetical protein